MALRLEDKKTIIAEVNEVAGRALSVVIADYRGVTVGDITGLRVKARDSGVYLRVVRNTLASRAVEGTEFQCLQQALVGVWQQTATTGMMGHGEGLETLTFDKEHFGSLYLFALPAAAQVQQARGKGELDAFPACGRRSKEAMIGGLHLTPIQNQQSIRG